MRSDNKKTVVNHTALWFLLLINIGVLIYFFAINGIFGREGESTDTILSAIQKTFRFLPASTVLIMYLDHKYNGRKLNHLFFVSNCIIVLILFFPFAGSISRFLLFGTYLILFADGIYHLKIKSLLPFFLLVALCVIFPAFNFFKNHTFFDIWSFDVKQYGFDYTSVDYDAYQMLLETIRYTKDTGFSYGKNILSSMLFFVPRSFWVSKSEPTGSVIAAYYGAWFTNLSCPYLAEFYYAFGFFGSVIGSFILGVLIGVFDGWIKSGSIVKKSYAYVVLGILLYWLRGAMLPTTAYLFSLIISLAIVVWIVKGTQKNNLCVKI